jgi:ketopantoate hydroxymethyltransferase
MVTAYDAPTARIASEGGVDLILVGDSVAVNSAQSVPTVTTMIPISIAQ